MPDRQFWKGGMVGFGVAVVLGFMLAACGGVIAVVVCLLGQTPADVTPTTETKYPKPALQPRELDVTHDESQRKWPVKEEPPSLPREWPESYKLRSLKE